MTKQRMPPAATDARGQRSTVDTGFFIHRIKSAGGRRHTQLTLSGILHIPYQNTLTKH